MSPGLDAFFASFNTELKHLLILEELVESLHRGYIILFENSRRRIDRIFEFTHQHPSFILNFYFSHFYPLRVDSGKKKMHGDADFVLTSFSCIAVRYGNSRSECHF